MIMGRGKVGGREGFALGEGIVSTLYLDVFIDRELPCVMFLQVGFIYQDHNTECSIHFLYICHIQ